MDLDQCADRGRRVGEDVVHDIGELRVIASGRAEQETKRGSIALDEPEVGGESLFDSGATRLDARGGLGEHLEQTTADIFENRDEQRALRGKVLVEDGLRHPGREGQVIHRRGVESTVRELRARDVEELSASFVGREARSRRSPNRRHPRVLDFNGIS
jgi:hypothetical protein